MRGEARNEAPREVIRGREGLRARNKREKLERILAAARTLFSERGFAATTTRDIAERAGVGTGTLFLYVHNKEELLLHLFREELERVQERIFQTLPKDASLLDQLMHVFTALLDFYSENLELSRTFIKELLFLPPELVDEHETLIQSFLARLTHLVEAAQARDEVADDVPPGTAAVNFFSLYLTSLLAWLAAGTATSQKAPRRVLREGLELQLRGLAPPGRKRSSSTRS